MASDYRAVRRDNERRYGTDIGRIGPMLLANRYDDRTHFIFELLQNAEDALARRVGWQGSRSVRFHLNESVLRVSHHGRPFDEPDVRGICGIAESTKDLTAIGRFGIGFKSVYAFTDKPEVHSGPEHFAIESFVWPVEVAAIERGVEETVFLIPLNATDITARDDVSDGLGRLRASALLFLRQIEEIRWSIGGGRSGLYLRESKEIDAGVRRVTVIGHEQGEAEVDESWLVFSHQVTADDGRHAGHVEIAFSLAQNEQSKRECVQRVERSPLVVFFPTVIETHLGFLVQGPYRTTPSRDNVPPKDAWNQHLVNRTASLLVRALDWLRNHDLLDTGALQCLPLDRTKFAGGTMLAPLFEATQQAMISKRVLPRFSNGHISARNAKLARTHEIRRLFGPAQLATLFEQETKLYWLSDDITQDRTPELRRYLIHELQIEEVTPEAIILKLDKPFLEAQPDKWILTLYEFLNTQPALRLRVGSLPLIRLEDGTHVVARANGQPQAFLPGKFATSFPTVRTAVCATEAARGCLRSLGLTEPDPVDDVVWNVLPKYRADKVKIIDAEYKSDIDRILGAFATDSQSQREKLISALRETPFVMVVDAGIDSKWRSAPGQVYIPTERLKELFGGVTGVFLVDDTYACLRGDDVRTLLETCGASRYLKPTSVHPDFTWEQRREMRRRAGHEESSGIKDRFDDWSLTDFDRLVAALPGLPADLAIKKVKALWDALGDVETRRGQSYFIGSYRWTHYGSYSCEYPSAFARQLNEIAWVPDSNGQLQRPEFVLFDTLGWKPNPFLQSKISFKPPIIDTLAREAGIEPGVLDLLRKFGLTSEAELRARLGLEIEPTPAGNGPRGSARDAPGKSAGDTTAGTRPVPELAGPEPRGQDDGGADKSSDAGAGPRHSHGEAPRENEGGESTGHHMDAASGGQNRTPKAPGARLFISYVGVDSDEEEADPDGLDHPARMALEAQAIDLILSREPEWQRTPTNNPGYDLFQVEKNGQPTRWCEVKAMTGSLRLRPVGLSHTQFKHAQECGEAFWLYVVEHAGTDNARIVRLQDPAGKARTFTFDHGWLDIADLDAEREHRGD
jgi:hypothetical protein